MKLKAVAITLFMAIALALLLQLFDQLYRIVHFSDEMILAGLIALGFAIAAAGSYIARKAGVKVNYLSSFLISFFSLVLGVVFVIIYERIKYLRSTGMEMEIEIDDLIPLGIVTLVAAGISAIVAIFFRKSNIILREPGNTLDDPNF